MKIFVILIFILNFCFASIGQITALVGDASITRASENIKVSLGLKIENKDIIKTQKNSKLQIIFTDNTIVTVGKNSALDISDYLFDEKKPENSKTNLNFFKGSFKTITGQIGKINRKRFKLKTKTASIGIRGTFILGNQDTVACIQGGISVESMGVLVNVDANEFTKLAKGKAPSAPKTLTQKSLQKLQNGIEPNKSNAKKIKQQVLNSINKPKINEVLSNSSHVADISNDKDKNEKLLIAIEKEINQNNDDDAQGQENSENIGDKIEEIEDINRKLSFEGKVQGYVYSLGDNYSHNIIQNAANKVSLDFDIGGGVNNMTGTMKFNSDINSASHSNVFTYDLSSSTANLNDNDFLVKAVHKDFETEYEFNLAGDSESVKTSDTVNFTEECVNGYIHKADITFEATKK